ncbi:hypothetical protein FA95DRAFT_1605853 [Auriscalpium vulgare]|uniref:Uncharacterized protein n=1 Tax=Auriscalpium vulgare TaxID=40419 RepID=A0ACB8RV84_9AGAM|nr:hypothetical protein FA95DRAFT_1605853 [Auriscalpium vulgare]
MVNWNDPVILARTYLDFVKLEHALAGVYIWEYVTNLHYEWDFMARKRKWLWTLSIYSFCRFCCLMFTILNLVGMDVTTEINCQAWIQAALTFADLALVSASLLIVLRIAAIWERNIYVIGLSGTIWLVNAAFWLRDIIRSKGLWNPLEGGCLDLLTERGKPLAVISFSTDASLLAIMLVGLFFKGEAVRFGIWRTLYHQGLIWLSMATIAEVPVIILLFKNINDVWNLMFQTPALLIMVIGATRMYRSLSNYGQTSEISSGGLPPSATKNTGPQPSSLQFGRTAASTTNASYAMRPIEIAVHRQHDGDGYGARSQDLDKVRTVDLEVGAVGAVDGDHALYGTKEKAGSRHSSDGY